MHFKMQSKADNSDLVGGLIFLGWGAVRLMLYLLDRRDLKASSLNGSSQKTAKTHSKETEPLEVN